MSKLCGLGSCFGWCSSSPVDSPLAASLPIRNSVTRVFTVLPLAAYVPTTSPALKARSKLKLTI